jgi:dienelactone hydrolase
MPSVIDKSHFMKQYFFIIIILFSMATFAQNASSLKEENITYKVGNVTCKGYLVYDTKISGPRPGVIVVHEWWGLNDYAKMRARMLAELGYAALALDMYGNGYVADNPTDAQKQTGLIYSDPNLMFQRFNGALEALRKNPIVKGKPIAAVGYCFGGSVVLNSAKMGADVAAVVSFHGGLKGPPVDKDKLKAKILVCNGLADKFVSVEDANKFKDELDAIEADYQFRNYADATHAFSNPASTEIGKKFDMPIRYNEKADKDSWNDMKIFLANVFK